MKSISDLAKEMKNQMTSTSVKICHFVSTPGGPRRLSKPLPSDEITCEFCGGSDHADPFFDPNTETNERMWICLNGECKSVTDLSFKKQQNIPTTPKRSIEWLVFCQEYDIGNKFYNVKFESILQDDAKISFLRNFSKQPSEVIYMQGGEGNGKTYAALGVCELITRSNPSCMFFTQKELSVKWLERMKNNPADNFYHKLKTFSCLVVDDFGIGEISPGFMTFFMDLINTRTQWTTRGTIITTNLNDKHFQEYCGAALFDRIRVGQKFVFKDKSRRKPIL